MSVSVRSISGAVTRVAVATFLLVLLAFPALADEVIRSFSSNVILRVDGSVDVTEIIEVRAEGDRIRRGIYRDIPTVLINEDGSKLRSNLEVVQILRDGRSEPFFTEGITNGLRIYIGDADVYLSPGIYKYTLRYTMTRMARRFETYDELFWNATGNFWDFAIESAVATITLPEGAVIENLAGYTGPFGSTESAVAITRTADNSATFRATRSFRPYEGMSVAASFQKGVLTEPQGLQRVAYFLSDHRDLIFPGIAVFLVLLYYFFAWDAVGRDPRKGTIFPLFHPPKNFSPALTHYVWAMGWKKSGWQAFTAAIINLGVKGFLDIDKRGKKTTLTIKGTHREEPPLPPGEAVIFNYLNARGSVTIDKSSGPTLNTKRHQFIRTLETENRQVYFKNNILYTIAGIALSLLCIGGLLITGVLAIEWAFVAVIAGGVLGGLLAALRAIWSAGGVVRFFQLAILGFLIINFLAGAGAFFAALPDFEFNTPAIAAGSIIAVNLIFAILMRAPTVQGRKVMDQIDGFRMYLETAEKERLNFVGEPELTVVRFERILPYAIALGVEKPWSERFENELARHAVPDARDGYHPFWYHGTGFSPAHISRDMSAIASGMSAAMIAAQPATSSSSGSGGGGSSGGGGGGGGGGGW